MAGRQANSAWRHYLFASAPAIIYWIFGGRFFPSLRTLVSARQTGSEWQGSIWQVCSRTAGSQPSGAERSVFLKAPANTLHEMKILDYTFPSSASLPLSCRALSLLAAASLLLANGGAGRASQWRIQTPRAELSRRRQAGSQPAPSGIYIVHSDSRARAKRRNSLRLAAVSERC